MFSCFRALGEIAPNGTCRARLAHGPLVAKSSEGIRYTGRVGIRVGPVRVATVGGSKLAEALAMDFCESCNRAVTETVARLKTPM